MSEMQAWIVLLATLLTIVAPFVAAFAGSVYKFLVMHLPSQKYALVLGYAKTVTTGIEQMMSSGNMSKDPATRKASAVSAITAILKSHGLSVSPVLINAAIEEAVSLLAPSGLSGVTATKPAVIDPIPTLSPEEATAGTV